MGSSGTRGLRMFARRIIAAAGRRSERHSLRTGAPPMPHGAGPFDLVIAGGRVIDGSGLPWFRADVGIRGDRIAAVGPLAGAPARALLDAAGKVVAPGFIDAHVHGDLMLLADPLHEPAVRQGVTTYIIGQDGVAMAPASPATLDYMRRYTAGFSGTPDLPQRWSSMAEYLACFERTT